jgi:hypothetical protein
MLISFFIHYLNLYYNSVGKFLGGIIMEETKLQKLIRGYHSFSHARKAYIRRVLVSLRDKSKEREDAIKMVDEWSFTNSIENVREVEYGFSKCQLCNHPENVYQYRIRNSETNQTIWTGSVCITNFAIPVYKDNGERVTSDEEIDEIFKENVKEIKEQRRLELISALIDDINTNAEKPYTPTDDNKDKGVYTLKQMKLISVMYNKANGNFISDDYISLFKVNMRLKRNKEELQELAPYQWVQFEPILGKYMFDEKHGFNKDMMKRALGIIEKYKPEKKEKFMKKVGMV